MGKIALFILVAALAMCLLSCNDNNAYLDRPFNYWLTDSSGSSAKVYHAQSQGGIIKEIPVPGSHPTGVTWDYDYLWVADYQNNNIVGINPDTDEVMKTLSSPYPHPTGIEFDFRPPTHSNIWVITEASAPSNKAHLTMISALDGTIEKDYELPYPNPLGLGTGPIYLLVTYADSPIIHFIDGDDGIKDLTLNTGINNMRGIDRNMRTGRFWVLDGDNNKLIEINYRTGEHLDSITPPGENGWGFEVDE